MNKEIVIATNNRGKQKEYLEMLNPIGYMVLTPRDLCVESNPEENGKNYRENSYIKALALSKLVHRPVIADDSGFEVEGLDGFPGLYSSRFADEYGGDYHKAGLALNEKLGDNPNRNAKFHCCICFFLCSVIPVRIDWKKLIIVFVQKNIIHTPGVDRYHFRMNSPLSSFLQTIQNFLRKSFNIPGKSLRGPVDSILKAVNLFRFDP